MSVIDSVLSVLSGGATGLIGTALQSVYQYKTRKLDIELEKSKAANELEKQKLDIELMKQEWASRTQIAEINAESAVGVADAELMAKSYDLEPQQYSDKTRLNRRQEWVMVIMDAIRAIIRPGLTIYLCVLTSLIYFQTRGLIQGNQGDSFALLEKLVNTLLYLFVTVVCWWFGTRGQKPQ